MLNKLKAINSSKHFTDKTQMATKNKPCLKWPKEKKGKRIYKGNLPTMANRIMWPPLPTMIQTQTKIFFYYALGKWIHRWHFLHIQH